MRKPTLQRQLGERNLFHGQQKRMWRNYLKTRKRNAMNRQLELDYNVENLNDSNIVNVKSVNISGMNWSVPAGNINNNTNVPANLAPIGGRRRRSKTRKTRKNRRSN